MCNFLSGYLTEKRGLRCNEWIDSHSDQIIYFGDEDLDRKRPLEILKWEITPPEDFKDFFDEKKWNFKIDQDEIPDWADVKLAETDVRKHLGDLLFDCPDCTNGIKILDGRILAIKGSGVVDRFMPFTIIRYAGYAKIEYAGSAQIKYANSAKIEYAGYASIEYADSAKIENAGNAKIKDAGSAQIKYANSAKIEYAGNAKIEYAGSAQIKYANSAKIENAGYAKIEYAGYASIEYANSAKIEYAGYAKIKDAGYALIAGVQYKDGEPIQQEASDNVS